MSADRRLATVLFTDMVGSTQRAAHVGDQRWRELLERFHETVRRELRRFGGEERGTAGDGFLATFDSPHRAILCAWSVREAVRGLGVEVRTGIHVGEVETMGRDVGGIAVHTGARVGAAARGGEILVSSTVREAEAGSGFVFEDRGPHELKGIPGEWRLYAVSGAPLDAADVPSRTAASPAPSGRLPQLTRGRLVSGVAAFCLLFGIAGLYVIVRDRGQTFAPGEAVAEAAAPGIAVLPFAVRGEGLDVWREGMVDVLSTNLDGAGGFRAIDSRTVLARWDEGVGGAARPDLAASLDVARRTGARYAVIGSALATGPEVRFAAEIYDVQSGTNLGEAQAVGLPDSVLSLVNDLSIQILRALPSSPGADTPWRAAASQSTASVPALKAYLEGEALYRRADFDGAAEGYRRALESDSTFALAAYRLGDAYGWMESIESDLAHEFLTRAGRNLERLPEREALLVRGVLILDAGSLEALPLFEDAVRRYPDDAEAWFLLGDTYVHLGPQALVDWREESDRALSRAVELDPGFAPYYLHLIENAVVNADTAGARSVFATMTGLVTTASNEIRTYGMGLSLALGDSAEQSRAIAGVDSVDEQSVSIVQRMTVHPRLYPRLARSVEAWRARPDATPLASGWMVLADLIRGRVAGAADRLLDPLLDAEGRAYTAYRLHQTGLQTGSPAVEEALAAPPAGDPFAAFYAGAYAAEQGRWPDHAKAVARIRTHARQAAAAGDTSDASFTEGAARALEGFGFLKKGDRESALQILQAAQRQATGYGAPRRVNEIIRWWLGELLLEMERPREAEPYFTSLVFEVEPDPLAAQRLGRIHEGLGDPATAREAYELFVTAWQDADPELQPTVEEARAAIARLAGSGR